MPETAIRGSTSILRLMEMYPDGRALDLMGRLGWPCGHCGARSYEPLALAAKRHGNPVQATVLCFRALDGDGPSEDQIAAALPRPKRKRNPLDAWQRSAARDRRLKSRLTGP